MAGQRRIGFMLGNDYTYERDTFYRLRKIRDRSTSDLVAEYKYNGLGYRISIHEDTDDDQDVDASDKWFHHAFDERWRWVATFREDDSDPKEEFLHHAAGLDGRGTGSYIDLVVLRDRDINSGWTSAADGTLEERIYFCQNWRADVSALVTDAGQMLEWVKYSAYGVPFGLPGGDANSDGDCDAADLTQVTTWVEMGPYDVRGDVDLDGDVDEDDSSVIAADYSGIVMGRGVLSDEAVWNRRGYAGMGALLRMSGKYIQRNRCYIAAYGYWSARDPVSSDQPLSQYSYCLVQPVKLFDPLGLAPAPSVLGNGKVFHVSGSSSSEWVCAEGEKHGKKTCTEVPPGGVIGGAFGGPVPDVDFVVVCCDDGCMTSENLCEGTCHAGCYVVHTYSAEITESGGVALQVVDVKSLPYISCTGGLAYQACMLLYGPNAVNRGVDRGKAENWKKECLGDVEGN